MTVQLYREFLAGWTLGAGNVALRSFTLDKSAGAVVASGQVDALGRGTLKLPGEPQGVLEKATLPARIVSKALSASCTDTFTESDPSARALMLNTGDFSTSEGGVSLYLLPQIGDSGFQIDVPVFVTRDDTLSGTLQCVKVGVVQKVTLPLHRGWNLMRFVINDDKFTLSVMPFGGLLSFGTKPPVL